MGNKRHSDNREFWVFTIVGTIIGTVLYCAITFTGKQLDILYLVLEVIKTALIVGTVLVAVYYVNIIFFKIKKEDGKEKNYILQENDHSTERVERSKQLEITLPQKEPINGSFTCPSCGASTVVRGELKPEARCSFCGAPLSDLRKIIQDRDDKYVELFKQQSEQQMEERREKRLLEHKETIQRLQNEIDEAKMGKELQEKENKRNHVLAIILVVLCVLLLILAMSFLGKHR